MSTVLVQGRHNLRLIRNLAVAKYHACIRCCVKSKSCCNDQSQRNHQGYPCYRGCAIGRVFGDIEVIR